MCTKYFALAMVPLRGGTVYRRLTMHAETRDDDAIAPHDQLGLRGTYNNSRFGDYVAGNSFAEGANIAGVNSFQLRGLQVPLNPDFAGTVIGSVDIATPKTGIFTPGATITYSTSYRTSDQPYFFANQGAYSTVDLSVRWRPAAESKLAMNLFVTNLTDHRILLRTTPNAGAVIYQDFANPRMFGARVSFNY